MLFKTNLDDGQQYRYALDKAGNRIDPTPKQADAAHEDWQAKVRQHLHEPDFNLLEHLPPQNDALAATCWPENRITELYGIKNRFDGAGNLIERSYPDNTKLHLGYDGAHRLTYLIRINPDQRIVLALYSYDAFSRRIMKEVKDGEQTPVMTCYGWDGDRLVHEATNSARTTYIYEPGSFVPMARIGEQIPAEVESAEKQALRKMFEQLKAQPGGDALELPAELKTQGPLETSIFLTDHAGTPNRLVDKTGKIIWEAQPDDWAAVKNEQGIRQPIRFQGQWLDEESGFYYNRFRYYDPAHGRYVTQDPIGLLGGVNISIYPTNPINGVDPLGLWGTDAHTRIINETFPTIPAELRGRIREGSEYVDRASQQVKGDPAEHAMCRPGEAAGVSQVRTCNFVREHMAIFNRDKDSTDPQIRNNAYFELGQALHPVMDSTSPAHRGCQEWKMFSLGALKHGNAHCSIEGVDALTPELFNETSQRMRDVRTCSRSPKQ